MKQGWVEERTGKRGTSYRVRYWAAGKDGILTARSKSFGEWAYGGKKGAEQQARLFLAKMLTDVASGVFVAPVETTVRELVDHWMAARDGEIADSTIYTYRAALKHLRPEVAAMPIQRLKPMHLQTLYGKLRTDGAGITIIRLLHTILNAALAQAVRWELITRNPASAAHPPERRSPDIRYWTPEQSSAFLRAESNRQPFGLFWRLALTTGMRRGEILALRWSDIDFTRKTISVSRTLTRDRNGRDQIGEATKSRNARRTIPLAESCIEPLKRHRTSQRERQVAATVWSTGEGDLVFTRDDGTRVRSGAIAQEFARAVKRSGIPMMTMHGMRHSFATAMLLNNVHPKTVATILGDSVEMVMRVYSHVTVAAQESAIQDLDLRLALEPVDDEDAAES